MSDKIAWVTGGSMGLGAAVVARLREEGWTVAVTSRGEAALNAVCARYGAHAFVGDVTDRDAMQAMVARIEESLGPVTLAILNAGTHKPMPIAEFSAETFRRLFEVNVMGAVHGLEALLPRMRARKRGRIGVVASVAGYRGLPTAAAYGMTKAGLINMTESLRLEALREGVDIRVVNPGFVRTPLTDKNDFPMPFLMEPDAAAARLVKGLTQSKGFEIAFPTRFALILKLLKMLPYGLYFRATKGTLPADK